MRNLTRFSSLLPALLMLNSPPSWGETIDTQAKSHEVDNKLLDWCLSYFPEIDGNAVPLGRPVEKLAAFDMKGVVAPPNLITETERVGEVPPPIRLYAGLWISPFATNTILPYAAFVERLTPTEMTIALLVKPEKGQRRDPLKGLRQKLKWEDTAFVAENSNLLGIESVTFSAQVSEFADAMLLGWSDHREGHLLTCLISTKHY